MDGLPGLSSDFSYDSLVEASAWYSREILERGLQIRGGKARPPVDPTPIHNVVGVTIGEKIATPDVATGMASIVVFVRRKYLLAEIPKEDVLPTSVDGIPVDVVETGTFVALGCTAVAVNPKKKQRPAVPGISVGGTFGHGGTGTFGAVVTDASTGELFILSNHHVLADPDSAAIDGDVFQPGADDAGSALIGKVKKVIPLLQPPGVNRVDAAIAKVAAADVDTEIVSIGTPAGTQPAVFGNLVRKFGRSTRCRTGRVDHPAATHVAVHFPFANVSEFLFAEQIVIRSADPSGPFSDKGDSGSLIVDVSSTNAVGLLFAGNQHGSNATAIQGAYTLANPINLVLSDLGVTFA